jgi:G:T/U-mismatch repair DNA glycosylase
LGTSLGAAVASVAHLNRDVLSFPVLWLLYPAILGQAIPSAFGLLGLAKTIKGADDSSIQNPKANDMNVILSGSNITTIFTTGVKATTLYRKYCYPATKIEPIYLPSTSAANCARYTYDDLVKAYQCILKHISS